MRSWFVVCLASAFAACTGEGVTGGPGDPAPPALEVTPAAATLVAGTGPVELTATLTHSSATIAWSLAPAVGALSSASGPSTRYLPPAAVGVATEVTVTASAAGRSAKATLTVKPAPVPALTLTASSADTAVGGAVVHLEAVPSGGAAGTVVWSTPAAGTLASAGNLATFTPPPALGAGTPVELTATLGDLVAHATVTVHLAPTLAVPAAAEATFGGAPVALAAAAANASAPVAFAVTAGRGSVSATGDTGSYLPPAECVYTEGESATVTSTVAGYGGLSASATTAIAVKQVGTLAIEPATLELAAGDPPTAVTALLAGGAHGPVRWALYPTNRGALVAEEGTATSYAPPPASGLTSASGTTLYAIAGCLTATASVVLHPAPLVDALEVHPPRAVALAGGKPVRLETATTPAGLSRTFTLSRGPGTLAQDGDAVVYTPPAQVGTSTATIGIQAGEARVEVPVLVVGPEGMDVEVFDPGDGWASPSGKIMLGGEVQRAPASGRLTFHGVHPPYDVVFPFEGGATIGQGLTADRIAWGFAASRDTTLSYTVTGRTPGLSVRVSAAAAGAFDHGAGDTAAGSLFASWVGPPTQPFDVYALEWQPGAGGAPAAWGRFLKASPPVTDAIDASVELALDGPALASAAVSGTLLVPAGHVNVRLSPTLRLPGFGMGLPFAPAAAGAWSYPAPVIPGVRFTARATASDASNDTTNASVIVVPGEAGVALELRPAPTAVSPAAGATGIGPGDALTVTGGDGYRYFTLSPRYPTTGPFLTVFASADTVTVPDLTALGIGLPSGGTYGWRATYFADAKYTWTADLLFTPWVGLSSTAGHGGSVALRTFVAR
ncbi:MAG: hypothetical protein QM704_07530 [Anaeromyxobacteraceae bacterium]